MDKQFQIISDSSCDLPPELAREKNIRVVPFYVSFDDKTYLKEVEEVGVREFYQRMVVLQPIGNKRRKLLLFLLSYPLWGLY